MSRGAALIFVRLMVALIMFECILAVCVPVRIAAPSQAYLAEKSFTAAFWSAMVAEPEEEKAEEKAEKGFSFQIADLNKNLLLLSKKHNSLQQRQRCNRVKYDQPSLLTLHCVFII